MVTTVFGRSTPTCLSQFVLAKQQQQQQQHQPPPPLPVFPTDTAVHAKATMPDPFCHVLVLASIESCVFCAITSHHVTAPRKQASKNRNALGLGSERKDCRTARSVDGRCGAVRCSAAHPPRRSRSLSETSVVMTYIHCGGQLKSKLGSSSIAETCSGETQTRLGRPTESSPSSTTTSFNSTYLPSTEAEQERPRYGKSVSSQGASTPYRSQETGASGDFHSLL
jgi:hypothetical protein